jgi:excisionase family DNA binding protein
MNTMAPDTATRMLLTVTDVARELGCGRDTVYALLVSGALRSVRLGGRLRRIRRGDLEAFVADMADSRPANSAAAARTR